MINKIQPLDDIVDTKELSMQEITSENILDKITMLEREQNLKNKSGSYLILDIVSFSLLKEALGISPLSYNELYTFHGLEVVYNSKQEGSIAIV